MNFFFGGGGGLQKLEQLAKKCDDSFVGSTLNKTRVWSL